MNKTTLKAHQNKIIPDQKRLRNSFNNLRLTLLLVGFDVIVFNFPKELNSADGSMHDAVFVRDVGMMFKQYWIKSNFSATARQPQAEAYAKMVATLLSLLYPNCDLCFVQTS